MCVGGGCSGGSVERNLLANVGDSSSIPGSWRSPGEGNSKPLQYSCLGNAIGRSVAETEAPILWPPYVKSQLIGKDCDAGKDRRQEETGMTDYKMVGWHHWLNGHEFELSLGDGEGQGSLAFCNPWGCKELDMTERLKNNSNPLNNYSFPSSSASGNF